MVLLGRAHGPIAYMTVATCCRGLVSQTLEIVTQPSRGGEEAAAHVSGLAANCGPGNLSWHVIADSPCDSLSEILQCR